MKKFYRIVSILLCVFFTFAATTSCKEKAEGTINFTSSADSIDISAGSADISEVQKSDKLLESMAFTLDGVKMTLTHKPYSDLKEIGWSFDPKLYGLDNISAVIGNVYQRSVYLNKEGYDSDVFCIGVTNFRNEPCGIEDIQLWSVEFTAHEKINYPDIVVDGGITWGSQKEDIIKTYGEPVSSETNTDTQSTVMHYTDNTGNDVYFEIYDGEGVGKIILESYKL